MVGVKIVLCNGLSYDSITIGKLERVATRIVKSDKYLVVAASTASIAKLSKELHISSNDPPDCYNFDIGVSVTKDCSDLTTSVWYFIYCVIPK